METLGNGLITLANGAWSAISAVADPVVLVCVLLGLSLLWLAVVETEEIDRQGTKPEVGRH